MELTSQTELQQGKYKIIRVLGQGGFGITYLAENTLFDQLVAIKEFFPKDFCDRDNTNHVTIGTQNNADTVEKLKARFLKEAKNIAKLDHPGIVRIHDVFKENETAYFVMEYIEGESLSEIIKRNGPLDEDVALEYIRQVGEALNYIHSRNMTHYDVKPANIMVRKSDNKPILIDFGLSKQYDAHGDATSTLMQGISQGFSPIELYAGGNITSFSPQTDIYSLGATLYYLIEGVIPPNAPDLYENGLEFHKCESASIKDAIQSAMNISKAKRPANIELFYNLLGSAETISSNSDADEDIIDEPSDVNRDLLSGQDENTLLVNDQAKSDIAEASNDIEESDDNPSISNEDESEKAKYQDEIEHLHKEVNFYKDKYHAELNETTSANDSIQNLSSKNVYLKGLISLVAFIAILLGFVTCSQCANSETIDQETDTTDATTSNTESESFAYDDNHSLSSDATTSNTESESFASDYVGSSDGEPFRTEMGEQKPSFPGGESAMYQWLSDNMNYPAAAAEEGFSGKVTVQFIVEKDGSITNVHVVRGKHPALDAEAKRVVSLMPKWNPGKNDGEPVRVTYNLPINFGIKD
jgi:TonB family protein